MVENLKKFGLSSYEERVYEELISKGVLTAHAITKESGVPSGKIYPVLESLIRKGFVLLSDGRPKMFVPVSPEIVFERVLSKKKDDLRLLEENANELVDLYSKRRNFQGEKEQEIVETYFGRSTAFARSVTLHGQAQKYWKTISQLTVNKKHLDACSDAIRRGIEVLAITSPHETNSERVKQWEKIGVKIRFLEKLPFRMSVYDGKGVVFRFSHGKSKRYVSTHIKNTKLASGMNELFDSLWLEANKKPYASLKKG